MQAGYFYSRPCGRGDRSPELGASVDLSISTHAPAGGATISGIVFYAEEKISTHAPAGGATDTQERFPALLEAFLLTPLREGRRLMSWLPKSFIYFYSRPCGRGDSNFPQVRHEVLRQIAER